MGDRITVAQFHQMILRGFHSGLTIAQLAHVFDASPETIEATIRKAMTEQTRNTTGIVG